MNDAVPEEDRAYGITICGAALGDDAYIEHFFSASKSRHALMSEGLHLDDHLSGLRPRREHGHLPQNYSLVFRIGFLWRLTSLYTLMAHIRQPVRARPSTSPSIYTIVFDIDILDPEGPVPGQDDPSFLSD